MLFVLFVLLLSISVNIYTSMHVENISRFFKQYIPYISLMLILTNCGLFSFFFSYEYKYPCKFNWCPLYQTLNFEETYINYDQ